MKKKLIIPSIVLLIVIVILIYFYIIKTNNTDAAKFKKEYEVLNTQLNIDGSKKYKQLSINKDNNIIYLNYNELMNFINEGTGILYFGRPGCPWCRLLVPPMLEFAKENNLKIYYYNIEADRDKNNNNYKKILNLLDEYLPIDTINQKETDKDFDKNLKRVILPHLFFLDQGKVQNQILLYEHDYLKNNEHDKLKELLSNMIKSYCNEDC